MTSAKLGIVLAITLLTVSCASGPKWGNVVPGISSQQVMKEMKGGPSKVDPYQQGYASWFYGSDYCILMKDDVVVSKTHSENKGGIRLFGLGGSTETLKAACVPPSQTQYEGGGKMERETVTPFGTIKQKE